MSSKKRNALAELAERMFREIDGRRLIEPNREDYDKARRIIAKLAKVKWWRSISGWIPRGSDVSKILVECRAIAEEGEDNGNE